MCLGLTVLKHYVSILIIPVHKRKCISRKLVEEPFFHREVILEILMIIEVITGKIGKDSSIKLKPFYALLVNGVGGNFHETVLTSVIDHFSQVCIDLQWIGRGMGGWAGLFPDEYLDGGEQSRFETKLGMHLVEQRSNGGLAVGTSNPHQV